MQNNNIHTDQPDVFSESVRQKLEKHELPVDAACWNEIEARMNANKKKKAIPFWWWLSGGAAVATLALLLTLRPFSDSNVSVYKTENKNLQNKLITNNLNNKKQEINFRTTSGNSTEKTLSTNFKLATQKSTESNKTKPIQTITNSNLTLNQAITSDSILQNKLTDNILNNSRINNQIAVATTSISNKDSVSTIAKKKYTPNSLIEETKTEPIAKTKNKNEWLLAAAFGSGGSTSMSGTNNFLTADIGNKNLVTAQTSYTNILTPNDFSQKNFMSPLSFGLIVRKNLNRTFGIESGLVYTYLLSTFEEHNLTNYDASLRLHYLGVPLNLVVQPWKFPKWEVYISGGGMVEKGVQSIYIQHQYIGNQTITTTAKTNIAGLQWSLNGGIGATYKLQSNIGIYFEPKFSYFFDNNQPVSVRTDKPVVVGLTAGLRFQF
jgi:hypothetical protein